MTQPTTPLDKLAHAPFAGVSVTEPPRVLPPCTSAGAGREEADKWELDRLRALATLGELTGTATHEFNNILMTIMNYAKSGLRDRSEAGRDKALTKILDASQRAARISSTILAQARNRHDSMQPTDLGCLINDTLELLSREMRKYRVSVETLIDPATPQAIASGNQIQRVLINLLVNARQSMPDGGTVSVTLAPDLQSGDVVLTVRDSGSGIPREQLSRIFDPFFSTKAGPDESGKGGTGLGLAACKDIIDAHQGRIRVESTVGRGTAFIIRLRAAA
jgi:signal transduction histidine kinase